MTRRAEKPRWRPRVRSRCGPRTFERVRDRGKEFPVLIENPYTANAYIVSLKCFHVFIWPDNSDDLRQYLFVEVKLHAYC